MPQSEDINAKIQDQGWRVFRSASRDHLIPRTGVGAILQRIIVRDALPVAGVFAGGAASVEERKEVLAMLEDTVSRARERIVSAEGGESATQGFVVRNITNNPGPDGNIIDDIITIGNVPFTGYISHVSMFTPVGAVPRQAIAIRTGGGASVFSGGSIFDPGITVFNISPDFVHVYGSTGVDTDIPDTRVAVSGGDALLVVFRTMSIAVPGAGQVIGSITFTSSGGVTVPDRTFLASHAAGTSGRVAANRSAENLQARLAIEKERTRRELELARIRAESKADDRARSLARSRLARTRVPRIPEPSEAPLEGEGMTYVESWMEGGRYSGYLIPNPEPGTRVQVWDGRWTVVDIRTGKFLSSGPIQSIVAGQPIPPGARVSRDRGIVPSPGLPVELPFKGELLTREEILARRGR